MKKIHKSLRWFGAVVFGGVVAVGCGADGDPNNTGGGGGAGNGGEGGSTLVCTPGTTQSCYDGPTGTEGVGVCKKGIQICAADGSGYGACTDAIVPSAETCNTPEDDDCDGSANEDGEGCTCVPGSMGPCYTGPGGTQGIGICVGGTQTCNAQGTGYETCLGEVVPGVETCDTAEDDDCDGLVNEEGASCACVPKSTAPCYSGPTGTEGIGICKAGTKTCNDQGTAYEACVGEVLPAVETCNTPEDDDCDNAANEEGDGCACLPNSTLPCYTGPMGTSGVGICKSGTQMCNELGTGYGACMGEVVPGTENCTTLVDDDCDGMDNESDAGCVCLPNSTLPCYTGPAGTSGVGICRSGTQRCNAEGTAYGACMGQVLPANETCGTPTDDDCDGMVNESGPGCLCLPNSTSPCYTGPFGTSGVGICMPGTRMCDAQGTTYGPCVGQVLPSTETCNTPEDDDCDGMVNESGAGCVCLPNSTLPCYNGPAGTSGVGICMPGTQMCNAQGTGYDACTGEVLPGTETCTTPQDDDCDGMINESGTGCVCLPGSMTSCYTGPAGTSGVGICLPGTQTCNAQGTGYGACMGQVLPGTETCTTPPADEDCDGMANEGCPTSTCLGGAPNGTCQAFESCNCSDCVTSAGCQATCFPDGVCTISDDCVCADCASDSFCGDPLNCDGDGFCDTFVEGCVCGDCATNPECVP